MASGNLCCSICTFLTIMFAIILTTISIKFIEYDSYYETKCIITDVSYPTVLPNKDNRRNFIKCNCGDHCQSDAGICNIMLQRDKLDQLKMFTEENEIIEDYSIVEFKYVHERDKFWKWIPLRVRTDKTAELRAGLKNFGNAYHVANSNWHTIHNPILEDMITTGNNIPFQIKDDDIYYNTFKGQKNLTRGLRDFHNLYVKSLLINNVSRPGNTLIDYAVGKGGDLPKWIGAKLSFVFGIDISRDNIENRLDGACARYLNYFKNFNQMPSALFVQGNSSVNIKNGDALFSEKGKLITNAVFGNGSKDPKILGPGVYKNFGIAQSGFTISSIQFAIHYVFESVLTLNNFLKNLAECTQLNGYFIGTSYDGNTIFKELKSKKSGESVALFENDSKIWELTKHYNESVLENNSNCLGLAIDVFQASINKTFREYVVNYDYLIRIIENYGFVPISNEEAKSFNLPSPIGLFSQLFFQMNNDIKRDRKLQNAFGKAPQMTEKERQISFLNKYFVFKKVRQVDIEAVYTEMINKTPEDDILDIEATIEAQQEVESLDAKPLPIQVVKELPSEVSIPEETSPKKESKKLSVKPKTKSVKEIKSSEEKEPIKVSKTIVEEPVEKVETIKSIKSEDTKEKEVTERPKKSKIRVSVKKSKKEEE